MRQPLVRRPAMWAAAHPTTLPSLGAEHILQSVRAAAVLCLRVPVGTMRLPSSTFTTSMPSRFPPSQHIQHSVLFSFMSMPVVLYAVFPRFALPHKFYQPHTLASSRVDSTTASMVQQAGRQGRAPGSEMWAAPLFRLTLGSGSLPAADCSVPASLSSWNLMVYAAPPCSCLRQEGLT